MYQSLKGRLRRPSAKMESSPEVLKSGDKFEVLKLEKHPPQTNQPVVSLQVAVAEVVINEEAFSHIAARPSPVTLEAVPAADWKSLGRLWQGPPAKRPPPKRRSTPREKKIFLLLDEKMEEKEEVDGMMVEGEVEVADHLLPSPVSESDSEMSGKMFGVSSPNGVKRKRGRPFKGQEKPVEERLMIETSKIRRLIDDILRKGGESHTAEFCLKLRNVARDIDEAMMSANFAHLASPATVHADDPASLLPGSLAHLDEGMEERMERVELELEVATEAPIVANDEKILESEATESPVPE